MNKFLFKVLSVTSCMLLAGTISFATSYTDTEGHWADKAIERWTGYNIVEGYGDRLFKPDDNMTRAELAQVVNKLLELKNKKGSTFSDVDNEAWFYNAISACNNAGIVKGIGENLFEPDTSITREEAMVMIGRALGIAEAEEDNLKDFKDADKVSSWAKGLVSGMVSKNIVQGKGDGLLNPDSNATRAEILEIINKTIANYVQEDGDYEITDEDKMTVIVAKKATIKGSSKGNIMIAQGAEDGDIKLDGMQSEGEILVKADNITIVLDGKTNAQKIDIAGTNDTIIVEKGATAKNVEIKADNAEIKVDGKVENIDVTENISDTDIKGNGTVSNVEVMDGAKNTTVETKDTEVRTSEKSENTVAGGKEVKPGDTQHTQSGSKPSNPIQKYTVTFDANGGINASDEEIKVEKNNKVERPENPTREGYVFDGWYLNGEAYDFENSITEDITLKAMWKFEIKNQATLEAFVAGKNGEQDITEEGIITEDIVLTSSISISRGLVLDGDNHNITMENNISEELFGAKYVICVTAGDEEVKLSNFVVDANKNARGIQAYMSKVIIEDVTIKNSTGEGLLVNGAIVTATNLKTSGNTWGAINVDRGEKVPEDKETVLTLQGENVLEDNLKIWSELTNDNASDIVKVEGYDIAKVQFNEEYMYVWELAENLEALMKEGGYLVGIRKENVLVGYKTLEEALENAEDGDVIKLLGDIELTGSALTIEKDITIDGNKKTITAKEKSDLSLMNIMANAKVQNVTFDLKDSKSRAIYIDNAKNTEKYIVELLNVTIMNGNVANSGSAIATKGDVDLILDTCVIKDNTTEVDAQGVRTDGAIFFGNTNGTLTLVNTQIKNNKSYGLAGGLWIASTAKLVVKEGCDITGNTITKLDDACENCTDGADIYLNANSSGAGENKGATAIIEGGTIGKVHVEYDKGNYAILTLNGGSIEKVHGNGNDSTFILGEAASYQESESVFEAGTYKWNADAEGLVKWEKQD